MKVQVTHSVHDIDSEAISIGANETSPEGDFYVSLIARVLELLDENDIIFYDSKQQTYFLFRNAGVARNKALPLRDAFVEDLVHWLVRKWLRKKNINSIANLDIEDMSPWNKRQLGTLVWWRVRRAECLRFVADAGKFAKNINIYSAKSLRESRVGFCDTVR